MTTTELFGEHMVASRDSSSFALFFAAGCVAIPIVLGTLWVQKLQSKIEDLYGLLEDYHKVQEEEHEHVNDLFVKTESLATREEVRTKKEYEPEDEVEEGVYQAWSGFADSDDWALSLVVWREKESTVRANQKWIDLSGADDAACVTRDFYLGNGEPQFEWVRPLFGEKYLVKETMVNGWGSVVRMRLDLLFKKDQEGRRDDAACNAVLQQCSRDLRIRWCRCTIPAAETQALGVA